MAKFECTIKGGFDRFLTVLNEGILNGSVSATQEGGVVYRIGNVRCAMQVYERYSWIGKNRVSLSVMLTGEDGDLHLTAIASGGSQAVFFKINTFGEEAFLKCVRTISENYHE